MLCDELTTLKRTYSFNCLTIIFIRAYGKTCLILIHILCSQHI